MKALLVLLGLITASLLSGVEAATVVVRAYNATGDIVPGQENITRGTRFILICDVEGLPEGNVVMNYTWYSNTTERTEIQREVPYYTAVNDTLLVDATFWGGKRRRHICEVKYLNNESVPVTETGSITHNLTEASTHFLLTPTSLLPNHTLITDVQQTRGREGQQWIKCTRGEARGRTYLKSETNTTISEDTGTGSYPGNGLYLCSVQPQVYYISLFLNKSQNSSYLPTPTVSARDSSMWTLTSPDGSQVERYIVEFECRVRNMTFVEKYISVSASGGTGRVATSVSCFGGLGQLYRVKVWAVSGPNISRQPAVRCFTSNGESTIEVDGPTLTTQVMTSTPTAADSTRTPSRITTSTKSNNSSSTPRGTPSSSPLTPSRVNTTKRYISSSTPIGTPSSSPVNGDSVPEGVQPGTGTVLGAGVGACTILVVLVLVGIMVAIVVVKRKTANKQKKKRGNNLCYNNPAVAELDVMGLAADYEAVDNKDKENGSVDGFNPYEEVGSMAQMKTIKTPDPKESSAPASVTNEPAVYAAVDKSKKKGAKTKKEDRVTVRDKDDLYAMPMKKSKKKDEDEGIVATGGAEKSEDYEDVAEIKYEPTADIEST